LTGPLWSTPTQAQAKEILVTSRSRTDALIGELNDAHLKVRTPLGGGDWSIKDLLGHLSGYEEQAVGVATGKKPRFDYSKFNSIDERNAADTERKRNWSLKRVRENLEQMRSALLEAIDAMDEQTWKAKIPTRSGRSSLALVLGRLLAGDRHGLFAHDLAHIRDLEKSVEPLKEGS
jgi:uncharacterized protein (TIGR03083 family)